MHWTTILSMLGCALVTAYLVFVKGWGVIYAGLTVVGSVTAVSGILLFILYVLSSPKDRADFLRSSITIMRGDLDDLLRMLRLRR